jgi:hypothetical protein
MSGVQRALRALGRLRVTVPCKYGQCWEGNRGIADLARHQVLAQMSQCIRRIVRVTSRMLVPFWGALMAGIERFWVLYTSMCSLSLWES